MAPILAGVFTLWAALVALAAESEAGVPRLLAAAAPEPREVTAARGLHVIHLTLLAVGAFLAAAALSWWDWPAPQALLRLALAVSLVWVVGDLLPRIWAANESGLVRPDGRVASVSLAVFQPLLRLVAWADRGGREAGTRPPLPPADAEVRDRLAGIFALRELTVADVMTPRMDVIAVDLSASRAQVLDTFRQSEHSRILVYDGDPDNVAGALYAKDLLHDLSARPDDDDWHRLVAPLEFVPEAKRLDRQLSDFQRSTSHLVVVVDEYGGTSGLVTLEDVLEEIVGEIQDEYDTDEVAPIQRTPEGALVVLGSVPLGDLEAELDTSFEREDVGTVGGLVLALAGRVPRVGDTFTVGEHVLGIDHVTRRRVRRVTVRRRAPVASRDHRERGGAGG